MAKIYISSTYTDLKDYREKVYHALRQMHHDVIAMEDYVATDQRPIDKCLTDVAACDLYIGIFSWRYGYIPPKNNPQQKSITELEHEKLVSFFETADQLIGLVCMAVYLWEKEKTKEDVLTVITSHFDMIMEVQNSIANAFTLFSSGGDIYPDQCDDIVDYLRTIHLPVYGLLDSIKSLPMTFGTMRYQLGGKLHHIEELTNELIQLINAFRVICRTSTRRVTTQRQDIQRKLEGFVQDIDSIKNLYKQLVAQLHGTSLSTNTPPNHDEPSATPPISTIPSKTPALPQPTDPTHEEKMNLLEIMHMKYSRQEFILLCIALGTSIEDLEEGGLKLKMLYLIDHCVRHNKYQQLLEKMRKDYNDLSDII